MLGKRFFDERNNRYLTVDGQGCDPKVYSCVEEEITEDGDLEVTGRVLLTVGELKKMREEEVW